MRLVYGEPPTDPAFHPETAGWTALREPTPWKLVVVGSVLAIPLGVLTAYCWGHLLTVTPLSFKLGSAGMKLLPLLLVGVVGIGFLFLIVIHELCHALVFPKFGMTRDTIIGAWPSKFLFYAGHIRAVSRTRYLLCAAMPLMILTVLPLAIGVAVGRAPLSWAALSSVNAFVCGGDIILFYLICRQVPRGAVLQNKGWSTWWIAGPPSPAADTGAIGHRS